MLAEDLFQRTIALMEDHKEDVRKVAELLLEQETISHSDVARLIGDRKFSAGAEYDEFVSMKKKMDSSSPAGEEAGGEGKDDANASADGSAPEVEAEKSNGVAASPAIEIQSGENGGEEGGRSKTD